MARAEFSRRRSASLGRTLVAALLGLLAGAAMARGPEDGLVEMVVGNGVWQPGRMFRAGDDWLALACTRAGCALEPARLSVRAEKWQGHYDDRPTSGQKLTLSRLKPGQGKVVAWLRSDRRQPWLAPGPVTTYASSIGGFKRPATPGTLERAVDLPGGGQARLVPMLDQGNRRFMLQLRAQGRRQMLGEIAACSHEVDAGYLLWAGDIDGDGRPDYLVSFVDADGQVVLYRSGVAEAGRLVGAGGVFDAPPNGGECDGDGWLGD